jgi:hypothetical protein
MMIDTKIANWQVSTIFIKKEVLTWILRLAFGCVVDDTVAY